LQDVLLVNPSQQYPADKSNDASSSLRSTELNGFAYRSMDGGSADSDASERCNACAAFADDEQIMSALLSLSK